MSDILTTEEQLKKFREGYKEAIIKYGSLSFPIRPLNAKEENEIITEINLKVYPNAIAEKNRPLDTMIEILTKAAYVNGTPYLSRPFLNALTSVEIETLYQKYLDIGHQVNPDFEELDSERTATLISDIKKNYVNQKDLSIIQLKAIGLYFLKEVLPMVKEHGSN